MLHAVQNAEAGITSRESEPPPSSTDTRRTPAFGTLGAGYKLGRYELLLPIAQGGMAVVWAARMRGSHGFSKIVAVKTMLPSLSGDPHFQQLFLAEAGLASRIKHPNVCEIFDLGEERHVLYIVMEWIDGESLSTLLSACRKRERRIPFAVATKMVLDAAKGLHAAHELRSEQGELLGLVHRDVSPQNVLVTYDGQVKIVDFGVAKAVSVSEHQTTKAGHVKGKVQYMAPEQAFCDAIDRRTDVFTLGIVLYQLTTGIHPFRAENELATLARITSPEPVPAPETLVKGYPRLLSAAVQRALSKDPDERYATMADFAKDLEAVSNKLAALGEEKNIGGFVREVLGDRAAERATAIKDALRDADDRVASDATRGAEGTATAATREGAEHGASGIKAIAQPAPPRPSPRGLIPLGVALGVVALGAVVFLASRGDPSTAAPAPPAPAAAAPTEQAAPRALPESPPIATALPSASAAAKTAGATTPTPKPRTGTPTTKPTAQPKPTSPPSGTDVRKPDF
jgi:hypothetical protein